MLVISSLQHTQTDFFFFQVGAKILGKTIEKAQEEQSEGPKKPES